MSVCAWMCGCAWMSLSVCVSMCVSVCVCQYVCVSMCVVAPAVALGVVQTRSSEGGCARQPLLRLCRRQHDAAPFAFFCCVWLVPRQTFHECVEP